MTKLDSLKNISSKLENISKTNNKAKEKSDTTPLVLSKVGVDSLDIKNKIDSANDGDLDALLALGIHYLTGTDVEQNYTLAKKIFEECIKSNVSHAYFGLGLIYQYGYNVDIDLEKSYECYDKGAKLKSTDCIYRKGLFLLNGLGVERNPERAIECFKKGADLSDPNSMFALANIYEYGVGVQQNSKTALNYYRLATDLGHDDAACTLAVKHIDGIDLEKNIAKAIELLEGPANNDDDNALYLLGSIYLSENDVLNVDKAITLLKKASNLKNAGATYLLAHLYRDGFKHIEPNMLISRKYYKLAIEQGDLNSKVEMTFFKRNNDGEWFFDYDAYTKDFQEVANQMFTFEVIDDENESEQNEDNEKDTKTNTEANSSQTLQTEEVVEQETPSTPTRESGYRNLYEAETISLDDIKVDPEFDELIKPTDVNDK